jgi:hypothetical protein
MMTSTLRAEGVISPRQVDGAGAERSSILTSELAPLYYAFVDDHLGAEGDLDHPIPA